MTTNRRWYQLSMLQMLVAMAVVAVLITVNIKVASMPYSLSNPRDRNTADYYISTGWPFTYKEAFVHPSPNGRGRTVQPAFHTRMLVSNVIVGLIVTCSVVLLFKRRHWE